MDDVARREHYPLRVTDVFAVAVFWTLLGFTAAAGRRLDPRIPGLPDEVITAVLRATYVEYALWAALTLPILWLTTRYSIERGRRLRRVVLLALLGIAIAVVMDAVMMEVREWLVEPVTSPRPRAAPSLVGLGMVDDLMVYLAVVGAGIARDYFLRYRARQEETALLQAQLAHARLDALRSQLNPHFLFNTLNAISALVERDPRGTRRMIARLSDLLRYTLEGSTDTEVPLQRELDMLEEYVELMQVRFQGKLVVDVAVEPGVQGALVPNLILQPIVENAIKHGMSREGDGRITITARRVGENLEMIVTDTGPGPGGGPEGVGLRNTNARLTQLYGAEHRVQLQPCGQGGTAASITLPFHTQAVQP